MSRLTKLAAIFSNLIAVWLLARQASPGPSAMLGVAAFAVSWIRLPDNEKFVRIEIEADRSWRRADFGRGSDRQERGVEVGKWEFAYWPPAGAVTIDLPSTPRDNGVVH